LKELEDRLARLDVDDGSTVRHGKKGELRRMRDEYAALKRDLADKKSRR